MYWRGLKRAQRLKVTSEQMSLASLKKKTLLSLRTKIEFRKLKLQMIAICVMKHDEHTKKLGYKALLKYCKRSQQLKGLLKVLTLKKATVVKHRVFAAILRNWGRKYQVEDICDHHLEKKDLLCVALAFNGFKKYKARRNDLRMKQQATREACEER